MPPVPCSCGDCWWPWGFRGAWWAAAIFAVHPVNVESVAWIAERKNLLAMAFAIPAFHAFVNWTDSGHSKNYWAAMGFFVLALAAKASVVALPALIATVVCGCASLSQPLPALSRRLPLVGTGLIAILAMLSWSWAGVHASHEKLWRDQLAKFPNTSLAHNILGTILSGRGKLRQAEEHFRQASALEPKDPIILTNLGTVTIDQGRAAEAAEFLGQAMRTRFGDPRAYISNSTLRIKGGDLEAGLDLLKEAAGRYPENTEVTSAAGASLLLADRPAEAIPFLIQCEQIEPRNAFVKWDLARAYEALGRRERARNYRRAALHLNPDLDGYRLPSGGR